MNSGCLEACVLFLLKWDGDRPSLTMGDLPDLWAPDLGPHEWRMVLARWIRDRTGRRLRMFPARPGRVCIAVGWSPRDPQRIRHAVVVGESGDLLFDPHPDGSGVQRPNAFYWW